MKNVKISSLEAFISYLNKDKISKAIGFAWIIGVLFTALDLFYFESRFGSFTLCFYYYITPIFLVAQAVRVVILIKRFKKNS